MRRLEPTLRRGFGFAEGVAAVATETKWGYASKSGEFVIEPRFEWADSFSEGLAAVQVGHTLTGPAGAFHERGTWAYITTSGERAFGGR
ncbi:MAG: WG repeat-containing protein, partial [Acidobacteria bacterium]|nr:WG repeat-containing protein [Acidobacteriota bacterium]